MKSRLACSLVLILAVSVLAGCGTFRTIGDFFGSSSKKTKIQGERISIIATEGQLASDPQLAASKMDLPPPKKNAEWPQPGGTADNVMGNLMADGPLARVWSASAGKGTDGNSRLTAPPIVAGGLVYVLDAQTQLAQAELNLIQSQVSFQLAVTQVDHATGDLLEHHHVQIVEPVK